VRGRASRALWFGVGEIGGTCRDGGLGELGEANCILVIVKVYCHTWYKEPQRARFMHARASHSLRIL
jgi:hypothetical protein